MNKITTILLISSLALGGFTIANANANANADDDDDDDYYEKRGGSYKEYERSGKSCDKRGKGSGSRIDRMVERLDLNDEQTKQVRLIDDTYRPKMDALVDKMKNNRKQLRELMQAESVDQGQVKQLAQVMGGLKTDKIILRSEMRVEINQALNKEQREEMKNWKGRRGHDHGHKRHDHI